MRYDEHSPMANTSTPEAVARRRIISVFLTQGVAGLLLVAFMSVLRFRETGLIVERLGPAAPLLILIFFAFALMLSLVKYELTNVIYVSLGITAYMAMLPLLGLVIPAWMAVVVAFGSRLLAMAKIGPVIISMDDPPLEIVKAFGLFGTYGIPVVAAGALYERLGGEIPTLHATPVIAAKIALAGIVMIFMNELLMYRPMKSYGYNKEKITQLYFADASIYLLSLPYAVVLALAYGEIGWGAVLALVFTGSVAHLTGRGLAVTRTRSIQQLQRIASLTNIGKTISLRYTTDQLLMAICTECKKIVDCSLFTIALLDESTDELCFELDVREGAILPKDRMPVGEGLNSWVVGHHQPLLIGSVADEKRLGVKSVADTKATESWLGVPMIARDRVIGVISVESYKKHAFSQDDILLLTAIANQAAVAIENAQLYKDLEGLTYALEQRVMERTNELRETNLRLLAADRSKNQFLANMSHELRTPLNSIIGFSSVLIEAGRSSLPQRMHKFLENIHGAGNHLLELINDILDLSKIEAGKMELRADEFDLRETIAAVERVMRGFAAEAKVQIVTNIDPEVPQLRLAEGRLKQILFNLLSNAVKFSPHGGLIAVSCRFIPRSDSPLALDTVRVDVTDQGIGIPDDELQRIFVEVYQTAEGRRIQGRGTGLGLSLTRNFVELRHGRIEGKAKPGEGSTFTLYLPVDYHEAAYNPRPYVEPHIHDHQTGLRP